SLRRSSDQALKLSSCCRDHPWSSLFRLGPQALSNILELSRDSGVDFPEFSLDTASCRRRIAIKLYRYIFKLSEVLRKPLFESLRGSKFRLVDVNPNILASSEFFEKAGRQTARVIRVVLELAQQDHARNLADHLHQDLLVRLKHVASHRVELGGQA